MISIWNMSSDAKFADVLGMHHRLHTQIPDQNMPLQPRQQQPNPQQQEPLQLLYAE